MAIVVACILWVYVMNEQNPITTRSFTVPLTALNLQENMMVKDLPDSVNVKVSGTRSQIASLRNSDVTAYIDFTDAPKGRSTYNVMASTRSGEITEISPSLLQLETDVMATKNAKIEARIVGVPHSGVTVRKMEMTPNTVTIRGAGERIDAVEKVIVMVDISNHDKDFETEATAVAVDRSGREMYDIKVTPAKVRTAVTIVRQLGTNEFPIKANLSGKLPGGFTLTDTKITPSSVKLTADPKVLGQITEIETAPIILDNISDSVELKMPLQIPDQVMAETHSVLVEIKVKKVEPNNDRKTQ